MRPPTPPAIAPVFTVGGGSDAIFSFADKVKVIVDDETLVAEGAIVVRGEGVRPEAAIQTS